MRLQPRQPRSQNLNPRQLILPAEPRNKGGKLTVKLAYRVLVQA